MIACAQASRPAADARESCRDAILPAGLAAGRPLLAVVFDQVFHLTQEGWRRSADKEDDLCPAIDRQRRGDLERDDFPLNRHPAPAYWWSMIFSENRYPLFGIML